MVRKITDLCKIERYASDSSIHPQRLALYLELARAVPGRLAMLANDRGYFVLFREKDGLVSNPSTVIEHYFVYKCSSTENEADFVHMDEVKDLLSYIHDTYENIWISFDNLLPNNHCLDNEDYRYNILPVLKLSYDGYLNNLHSDRRRGIMKVLAETGHAQEQCYMDNTAILALLNTLINDHCNDKYADDSLLAHRFTREEIYKAIGIFPCKLHLITLEERYAFLLSSQIKQSLYIMLAGGSDPLMLKHAYHSLIHSTLTLRMDITEIDAGSCFPFAKRQVGFEQRSFYALLKGEMDWMKYLF